MTGKELFEIARSVGIELTEERAQQILDSVEKDAKLKG